MVHWWVLVHCGPRCTGKYWFTLAQVKSLEEEYWFTLAPVKGLEKVETGLPYPISHGVWKKCGAQHLHTHKMSKYNVVVGQWPIYSFKIGRHVHHQWWRGAHHMYFTIAAAASWFLTRDALQNSAQAAEGKRYLKYTSQGHAFWTELPENLQHTQGDCLRAWFQSSVITN